jgi:putative ATP-dependent endonuclease of OLD family
MGVAESADELKLSIVGIHVQNLRGFADATLNLSSPTLFLVGPNNSGKTSLLRLLDVFFTWDLEREYSTKVSDDLLDVLLPARETRNAARRLTVTVCVADGRRHRALGCTNGQVDIRLSLTVNDRRLRANLGQPRRNESHDTKAAGLIQDLRNEVEFVHIPAGRSVDSASFGATLSEVMTQSLASTLQQPGKGATRAEREAMKVVDSLEKLAGPLQDFWKQFLDRLPSGWVADGQTDSQVDREVLARFVVDQLALRLATGTHDISGVPPREVGSGLQSLLDLELRRYAAETTGSPLFLAIEEPEVFLHPSAQRYLGRMFADERLAARSLVSSHSPLVLEEARFEQVALVRDHVVHQPRGIDGDRAAINSWLMSGRGAEVFFARSVLLVEGPGDREFFEALRRRLARYDKTGSIDHCYVVDVGANSQFAPWLKLVRAYSPPAFSWLGVLDSDSVNEVRDAVSHAGLHFSARQTGELDAVKAAIEANDLGACEAAARRLAKLAVGETPC